MPREIFLSCFITIAGDDPEMSAVGSPRTAQTRMAEADDFVVPVIISGSVQRLFTGKGSYKSIRIGAESHHTEGTGRPRKIVTANPRIPTGADECVHVFAPLTRLIRRLQNTGYFANGHTVFQDQTSGCQ